MRGAYYDTCVFVLRLNAAHSECNACSALLDPAKITWTISYGELSGDEAPIKEVLEMFEVVCAQNGIDISCISKTAAASSGKDMLALKKKLRLFGLSGRDWKHLTAAVCARATDLITDDRDFWDPASKSTKAKHPKDGPVRKLIRDECAILVELPSRAASSWGVAVGALANS